MQDYYAIIDAANYLKVSTATIYNWIKAGYLIYKDNYGVEYNSILDFQKNISGKYKLNKRANKLELDKHNHLNLIKLINDNISNKDIADIYQNNLANSYKNKEGIYYTPITICQTILSDLPKVLANQTFCDPCCGGGNFMLAAIEKGFAPQNVYGFDLDPIAVQISRQRILQQTGFNAADNILCLDYLQNPPQQEFDVIATNPPWGKKLKRQEKIKYAKNLNAGTSFDTCSLFFLQALFNIKKEGYLSLLLPDAFFNIASFKDARTILLKNKIISLRCFNNAFKGIQAKAQSFYLQKLDIKNSIQNNKVQCYIKQNNYQRLQTSFIKNPKFIINFNANDIETNIIKQIYSKPYITLKDNARWALGIVTGNNNKFVFKQNVDNNLIAVYKGSDIYSNYLKEPNNFLNIKDDVKLYQQVPPLELFNVKEKIIYRFISNKLVCYYDTNKVYCLNSANLFIINKDFPVSMLNITKLFNSKLYNWLFNKLFNTHKVLRSDLEFLPIHPEFFNLNKIFNEEELLNFFNLQEDNNGSYTIKS